MKKLLLVLAVLALLPTTAGAATILDNSTYLIGTVVPGVPSNPADEYARLEYLIDWYNSGEVAQPLPAPDDNAYAVFHPGGVVPATLEDPLPPAGQIIWSSNSFTLPGSYLYMMVKFGRKSAYYYIGGLSGELTLVSPWGPQGGGVSHVDLFNEVPNEVPEPASMLLLGTGVLGLASLVRRRR